MSPDIFTLYAIDFIGELLMVTMLICSAWRLKNHGRDDRLLRIMMACTLAGCLMDQLWASSIGITGTAIPALIVISNTGQYAVEMIACYCWALFINIHMRGSISRFAHSLLLIPAILGLVLLLANLFTPILFNVDDSGIYHRLPLTSFIVIIAYSYFIYSICLYIHLRRLSGGLQRLFPGWALMLPVAIGGSVQLLFPSSPIFWTSMGVGITGTIVSLQNEDIYHDRLTGLFNRAFLEYISSQKLKTADAKMTGIMIDLNEFKTINDRFGHNVGDQAIINAAHIIRDSVGDIGLAARYAGDEFVVLLNTGDRTVADQTMNEIRQRLVSFSSNSMHQYSLSASMGQFQMEPCRQSLEQFIANIDRAMYEDKKRYYEEHPEADRRASR